MKLFFQEVVALFLAVWRFLNLLLAAILIGLVRVYQWTLSPIIGRCCRFTPTCSQYFILAVKKHGPLFGTLKGIWRIIRCNPFCEGGEDWP